MLTPNTFFALLKSGMFLLLLHLSNVNCNYTCLVGIDLLHPQDCENVNRCGPHEKCSLEQYVTPSGLIRYKAGCKDITQCRGSSVQQPNLAICTECCNENLCAASLCGNIGLSLSGPICYHCPFLVENPNHCDKIRQCGLDEVCGVAYVSDGQQLSGRYDVSCMKRDHCQMNTKISACTSCCTTNLCNDKCLIHTCVDEPSCNTVKHIYQSNGRDICTEPGMKYLCNNTCALCTDNAPSTPTANTNSSLPGASTTMVLCSTNICKHGRCSTTGSGYKCTCDPGYYGTVCENRDICYNSPCKNGNCSIDSTGMFSCNCNKGFTGFFCDKVLDCTSHPCVNGNCTADATHNYVCQCAIGFYGRNCEKQLRDCKDIREYKGANSSEFYNLVSINGHALNINCDFSTDGGNWTIVLNRMDPQMNFYRNHQDYVSGFGDSSGRNFWIGLEQIYGLTSIQNYDLRVELTVTNGSMYYEVYNNVSVGAADTYTLNLGGSFYGTAGDSLSQHSGYGFTTMDVDHDNNTSNCAVYETGAWWFHSCFDSCLTCMYRTQGISTKCTTMSWRSLGDCTALKTARMMIRRA